MLRRISLLAALVLLPTVGGAAPLAELRDVRLWDSPEGTRVVFDLSGAIRHNVFSLSNPERLVIDIEGVSPATAKRAIASARGVVQKVRAAERGRDSLRVVLDLSQPVSTRSFALTPTEEYGHRLVLDLSAPKLPASMPEVQELVVPPAVTATAPLPESIPAPAPAQPAAAPQPEAPPAPAQELKVRPVIIAVDAGHGGEDPGARGRTGLQEKQVTLAISKRLVRLINAEPGMKAVLTREGDYYVGLRERVNKARKAQADLFVSVHANAFKDRDMHGTAVYTLSNRGATSEQARWLAQKENAADMVGGIDIQDKEDELAKVLIDLSQDATMEASYDIGDRVLKAMGKVNALQKRAVQQAGFAVLKAPDIPSVLIETAFITNSREEKLLGDPEQQGRLAAAILEGIRGYFSAYRPHQQVAEHSGRLIKVSDSARGTSD